MATSDNRVEHFYDRSLRRLLQDGAYVRWLVKIVAPEIERYLDFNAITYHQRSFISEALQQRESDVLLSVRFNDETGTDELLIYILIEHQSTVDKTMGFRLLSYMMQIWEAQRKEWESSKAPVSEWRLQPILPILFYTGDGRWTTPLSLTAIMDVPEILSRFVPSFDTLFLDVKLTDPEVLTEAGHPLGWLLSVLQKEDAEDTSEISEALLAAVSHLAGVDEAFAPQVAEAFRYFVQLIYHRRSVEEREALIGIIRDHIEDKEALETMAQTTAELLIEQGEARGLVKGKVEGKVEGKQDAVLKILQHRFQQVPDTLSQKIAEIQSIPKLDTLLERAMIAESLEQIDKET